LKNQLHKIVSTATGIPIEDLKDDTNLIHSSHLDSMSLMAMIIEIEEEFHIDLGYSELLSGCQTFGGLERAVSAKQLLVA
jgi:acyl carrier protein